MAERAQGGRGVRIAPMGDAALLVTLGDEVDLAANAWAHRVAARLAARRADLPGLGWPVPGHASVLAAFDPDLLAEAALRSVVEALLDETAVATSAAEGALHEIGVAYGGDDGPDLADVAARVGLSERDVVRLHAGVEYRVLVLGFVPGFPYLGIVPAALELPRRETPRVQVPAGSVAIAGRQAGHLPVRHARRLAPARPDRHRPLGPPARPTGAPGAGRPRPLRGRLSRARGRRSRPAARPPGPWTAGVRAPRDPALGGLRRLGAGRRQRPGRRAARRLSPSR